MPGLLLDTTQVSAEAALHPNQAAVPAVAVEGGRQHGTEQSRRVEDQVLHEPIVRWLWLLRQFGPYRGRSGPPHRYLPKLAPV